MKIALVGAGLSGLTLAHKLKNIAQLSLFEKSRGFGGRMATRHYKDFSFDHGAQFFKARTKTFQSFLKPMIEKGILQAWKGSFIEFEGNKKISQRLWEEEPAHYVGVPSMNAIGKHLAESLKSEVAIHLNTKVTLITRKESSDSRYNNLGKDDNTHENNNSKEKAFEKWELWDESHQSLGTFDWLIVATPAKQALAIIPKSFQHYSKLSSVKMQACFSLMLGFKQDLPLGFQSAFVKGRDISWISVNSSKPQRKGLFSLLVHSTNNWADAHLETDKEEVKKHLIKESSFVLAYDVSKADHQSLHLWRYANREKQASQNWIDEKQRLALCGDWTKQGKVEAAFLSAEETAQSLSKIIKL